MSQRVIPSSFTAYTSHKDDLLRMAMEKGYSLQQFAGVRENVEYQIRIGCAASQHLGREEEEDEEQLAQAFTGGELARSGESTNSSCGKKVHGYTTYNPSALQSGPGISSSQTRNNRSSRGRDGAGSQSQIIKNAPIGPRAMSEKLKGGKEDRDDQGPKIKREYGSPGFSQSGPGIGEECKESGLRTQSADISQGRHGSSMGVQHVYGVPEEGFKSERVQFQDNDSKNDNVLSQHVDWKASNTEMSAAAVVKHEHYLNGTKRKIEVEEEEDGDNRPVSR